MNTKKTLLITILSLVFVFFVLPLRAAETCKTDASGRVVCKLENPLGGDKTSVPVIIGTAIKSALGIVGAITLLMLVYGGFQWLTSAGNPEKVKSGAQTMLWAVIGVILVFASYLLLSTFTNYLAGTQ